ncbi:MAG: hypothetical protein EXR72_07545 [Myxococcales bacterium]|nr:hypothetical protein [Myxococcales bacterium]
MSPQPLERLISFSNHFRRPLLREPGATPHKEWFHFCVLSPGLDLFINYSLMEAEIPGLPAPRESARVCVLVRTDAGWDGDVDTIASHDTVIRRSGIDATFGPSRMRFHEGAFELTAKLCDRPIELALTLVPLTMPLMRPNTPLEAGPLHWLVVPRLSARGTVRVGERTFPLDEAPAYHDHNWGRFRWGQDFAWQWGFALPTLPESPYCLAFVRLCNRARTSDLGHGLFLWKGGVQRRIFREGEVQITPRGWFAPPRPSTAHGTGIAKFPRPLALLAPEQRTDVPRTLDIEASARGDFVRCRFETEDLAQIIIPDDNDFGITVINEVRGRLVMEGEVAGEPVEMEGRSVFEFLSHG